MCSNEYSIINCYTHTLSHTFEESKLDLHLLLKFGKSENLQELCQNGELYMGTLKSYRESDNSQVCDKNEGAHKVAYHPKGILSRLDSESGKNVEVGTLENIVHREFNEAYEFTRVFCMYYAITPVNNIDTLSSIIDHELIEKFEYDSVTVIFDLKSFFERLDNHFDKSYKRDAVNYIDFRKINRLLTPFDKDLSFKHQNEFRICVPNISGDDALKTHIGSIADISFVVGIEDIDKISVDIDSQITFSKTL
jgi:hypothetical protein